MRTSRRVVTVLFADLVGFTTLSERLDAEDVAAVQQAYFQQARERIERHGGLVEKFIGDAVVGSFGVWRARDDDAQHAVRAGLDVVAAVAELAERSGLGGDALQVRVGVNTGEALISSNGPEEWQLTGDVVNVASRLQAMADPGTVLVGSDTALAVEAAMALEPLGPLGVKGKAAALKVWRVTGPRSAPLERSPMLGVAPATYGRSQEIDALLAAWRRSTEQALAWLVTAPPGAGKSRLVDEVASRIEHAGGTVWTVRVTAESSGYRCVADLVAQSLGGPCGRDAVLDSVRRRLQTKGASELQAAVSAEHTWALLAERDLDAEPADLFTSWIAVLETAPTTAPSVWVLEDLHHAGPDLLEFLRFATGTVGRAHGLLVLTSRPTPAVENLSHEAPLQSLHLDPLDRDAAVAMIEALLGTGVLDAALVGTIADRSRGNPLFIEELFRSWVQAGLLEPSEHRWRFVGSGEPDRLPTTVQSVYLGQLDGLPEDPRQVIHSGSIPGHTFPSAALPTLEVTDAEAGLQLLTELGLIVGPHQGDADPRSYTYRHGLLREVAYASLSRADRARLHLRFARWVQTARTGLAADEAAGRHLAAAHDNLPRLAGELEPGLTRGALAEDAAGLLEDAAVGHLTSAPTRAAALLERALDLGPAAEARVLVRRTLLLGAALQRAGRLEEAMRSFQRAGDLAADADADAAADAGDGAAMIRAALGYEDALFASRLPREEWGLVGMQLLVRALSAATDDEQRAWVKAALGRAQIFGQLFGEGDLETGREACAQAVQLAQQSGSDAALAYALLAARSGQMWPVHLKERRRSVKRAIAAARRAGDSETDFEATRMQLVDALEDGDRPTALAARVAAEALIAKLRRPLYFWYPPMWHAMEALLDGDAERAAPLITAFREESVRWHYRGAAQVHAVQVLELQTMLGSPSRAVPLIREQFVSDPLRWTTVLGAALARSGEHDEARLLLEQMLALGFEEPRDLAWTYLMALRAECAATLGHAQAAAEVTRLLNPWRGHAVVIGSGALCLGAVSHYLGLAARTMGKLSLAMEHFAAAYQLNTRMGAGWAAERSRQEHDRTLSDSHHSDGAP